MENTRQVSFYKNTTCCIPGYGFPDFLYRNVNMYIVIFILHLTIFLVYTAWQKDILLGARYAILTMFFLSLLPIVVFGTMIFIEKGMFHRGDICLGVTCNIESFMKCLDGCRVGR